MRGGILLLVIALFVIYLGVSGKICCFTNFLKCAFSTNVNPCECETKQLASNSVLPKLPKLPALTSLG